MEMAVNAVKKMPKYQADLKMTANLKFSGPRKTLNKTEKPFGKLFKTLAEYCLTKFEGKRLLSLIWRQVPADLSQTDERGTVDAEHTELVDDVLVDRGDGSLELVEDQADDAGAGHAQQEHGDNAEIIQFHCSLLTRSFC